MVDHVFDKHEDSEKSTKPKPRCPKRIAAEKRALERVVALRHKKQLQVLMAAEKEHRRKLETPILEMLEEMTALTTNERNGGINKR